MSGRAETTSSAVPPHVVVIAGPNGAGKSTSAAMILRGALGVEEFVNADVIARGLSAFRPEAVALSAGRLMLLRLRELAAQRANVAFETTLASRSFAPWLQSLQSSGYHFHLIYVWVRQPELAVARVRVRVGDGGHHVPDDVVHRRYHSGIHNFFHLYRPLAHSWRWYDNSDPTGRRLIASGGATRHERIYDRQTWEEVQRLAEAAREGGAS